MHQNDAHKIYNLFLTITTEELNKEKLLISALENHYKNPESKRPDLSTLTAYRVIRILIYSAYHKELSFIKNFIQDTVIKNFLNFYGHYIFYQFIRLLYANKRVNTVRELLTQDIIPDSIKNNNFLSFNIFCFAVNTRDLQTIKNLISIEKIFQSINFHLSQSSGRELLRPILTSEKEEDQEIKRELIRSFFTQPIPESAAIKPIKRSQPKP